MKDAYGLLRPALGELGKKSIVRQKDVVNKSRYALFLDGFVPQGLVRGPEKPANLKERRKPVFTNSERSGRLGNAIPREIQCNASFHVFILRKRFRAEAGRWRVSRLDPRDFR